MRESQNLQRDLNRVARLTGMTTVTRKNGRQSESTDSRDDRYEERELVVDDNEVMRGGQRYRVFLG